MTAVTPPDGAIDVDAIAADWFARRRSGTMTAAEDCELQLWLARDARNREAFATAEAVWQRVGAR
jgi:transmembrane sensor